MRGFTLLELSIVLVIIGLIVGGITVGSSMIRAAEVRKVLTQTEQYRAAVYTFRDKYMAIPGDMPAATDFWGAEPAANCPGDETLPSTTAATCNGDGDRRVEWQSANSAESPRFWQHLANAGLIKGQFTGVRAAGTCNTTGSCNMALNENIPESAITGAGWTVLTVATGAGILFARPYGLILYYGRVGNYTTTAALETADAWSLDKKADDGRPGLGWVTTLDNGYHGSCADSDDPNLAEYQPSLDGINCALVFLIE